MKRTYWWLSIVGFVLPNIWVAKVSIETGNLMLWFDPRVTFTSMFANDISSAFSVDLLFVVLVFFIWTYTETQKLKIKNLYAVWIATMLLGLAGAFPLFLYFRERAAT